MSEPIYYLAMNVTSYDKTISKTYYLADICRDNAWVGKNGSWKVRRFFAKFVAEHEKEYYEKLEKSHPSYTDATVSYEVVTRCPYDNYEEALAYRKQLEDRMNGRAELEKGGAEL